MNPEQLHYKELQYYKKYYLENKEAHIDNVKKRYFVNQKKMTDMFLMTINQMDRDDLIDFLEHAVINKKHVNLLLNMHSDYMITKKASETQQ